MIYNYLMSDYVNRENYRYNPTVHKKSELKKIYSDIVKISKESPSYLFRASKETQDFAIQLKEGSLSLQNTLRNLQNNDDTSAFSYKQVCSDNEEALTTIIDTEDHSNLPDPFSVEIHKLAINQKNIGNYVYRDTAKLKEGIYQFQIDVEDDSYLFQLQLRGKTTNEDALNHIVHTINNSGAPIIASTSYDKAKDKIQIVLQSEQTGSTDGNPIFQCSDISHPSTSLGCVEYFNLNHIVQLPENSSFSINGEEKNTISNEFTLNNALHLTMHAPTQLPIHINYGSNVPKIMSEINGIADTYNQLIHLSYNQGNPPKLATLMLHDLKGIFSKSKADFTDCGITFNEEGYMEIDKITASDAATAGKFQNLFGSHDTIGARAMRQFKDIAINPMKYIEDKVIVTYPNPTKENFANPYMTSMYSGMLFNSYC